MADMAPAKAHPYMVSFGRLGLIEQDRSNGHYQLGPLALQLGLISLQQANPVHVATPLITELAQSVQGQAVITREEWRLQAGGRELLIERLVTIQHGYTMRGARSYNTAKDVFVKAVR